MPPIIWMALIFWLSSDTGSSEHTGAILRPVLGWLWPTVTPPQIEALHGLVRKAGHLTEFGVLAVLWYRAFRRGRAWDPHPAGWCALALSIGWAVLDEMHQSFVASRTASAGDVLVDAAGAMAALAATQAGWRATMRGATTLLLWVAALGGAALLLIDALAGVRSGWLWLTVPGAVVVLVARRYWKGTA